MSDLRTQMGLSGQMGTAKPFRPLGSKEALVSALTVQVENKPQLLRAMRPFRAMVSGVPTDISANARLVLLGLFDCFRKHSHVKEGIADDILWGFQQSGYDLKRVAYGLVDLKRAGYLDFQAPDGAFVDEHSTQLKDCWVRYTDKILDLVYS